MKTLRQLTKPDILSVIFFICLFAAALFFDWLCCAASVLLLGYLIYKCIKNGGITLKITALSVSLTLVLAFYLLSTLWAVDSGMALYGALRFLPAFLFALCLMQGDGTEAIIKAYLPYATAFMTVVSAILMQIPSFSTAFSVAGRLSGFLQYSNTFAMLLLLSVLTLISDKKLTLTHYIMLAVHAFGILYSGSRTVFVLAALSVTVALFMRIKGRARLFIVVGIAVAAALLALIAFLLPDSAFSRFITLSLESSTLVGRFLYWQDALPLLLKNPFGLGYMGYYYLQQSVQTGLYSVRFIHNDLLQFMLDVGWLPALLMFFAFVKPIFLRTTDKYRRLMISVFALHCLFDFDLQFAAMLMLMILLCDENKGRELKISGAVLNVSAMSLAACVCIYFGIAQLFYDVGLNAITYGMYPVHTQNNIEILKAATDAESMDTAADRILECNKNVSIAYSAKAKHAYSSGDIGAVIQYKNKIFEIAPYTYEDYEEYCYMLITCRGMYLDAGDKASAQVCLDELVKTKSRLDSLPSTQSVLGKKIYDQPNTTLPDDILEYIENET